MKQKEIFPLFHLRLDAVEFQERYTKDCVRPFLNRALRRAVLDKNFFEEVFFSTEKRDENA